MAALFLTSTLDGGERLATRLRPLYLRRKSPWYPLNRMLGGPQSLSGRCRVGKILKIFFKSNSSAILPFDAIWYSY
jgi:hypothetical protein